MWVMWGFAVFIPLGIVWAFVTGQISTGRHGRYTVINFGEDPVRFLMVIAVLCVMEWFVVKTLLGVRRQEEKDHKQLQRRGRKGTR